VVLCVTSLVMTMAQDHPDAFAPSYQKAVDRLHRVRIIIRVRYVESDLTGVLQLVVDHEYAATYEYYKVPTPWLQVKLIRLLQYYPPSGDHPVSCIQSIF
jgi:AP-2 complex subunit alpha